MEHEADTLLSTLWYRHLRHKGEGAQGGGDGDMEEYTDDEIAMLRSDEVLALESILEETNVNTCRGGQRIEIRVELPLLEAWGKHVIDTDNSGGGIGANTLVGSVPGEAASEWSCPSCTCLNPLKSGRCDACGSARPAAGNDDEVCGCDPRQRATCGHNNKKTNTSSSSSSSSSSRTNPVKESVGEESALSCLVVLLTPPSSRYPVEPARLILQCPRLRREAAFELARELNAFVATAVVDSQPALFEAVSWLQGDEAVEVMTRGSHPTFARGGGEWRQGAWRPGEGRCKTLGGVAILDSVQG